MRGNLSHLTGARIDIYQIIYAHLTGLKNGPLLDIFCTTGISALFVFT